MLHHEYDALKGYRFLGVAISFYSVSCMSDVIFNPSLLNWSSLILTVAHMNFRTFSLLVRNCTSSFLGISRCCPHMNTFNNQPLGDPEPQATHEVVVELHGAHLFSEGNGADEANFFYFLTDKTGVMLKLGGSNF